MRLVSILWLYLFFYFQPTYLSGQGSNALPEIVPVRTQSLVGEDDPTHYAYRNLVIDNKGRLWLKTIGVAEQLYAMQVFQFDGYNHWLINVARDSFNDIRGGFLQDCDANGRLYGYLNDPKLKSALYTLDVELDHLTYTTIPEGMVGSVLEYQPGRFWVLGKTKTAFQIYDWDGKSLDFFATIPNTSHYREAHGFLKFADTHFIYADSIFWILDGDFPIISYDAASKTTIRYTGEDFAGYKERQFTPDEFRNAHKNIVLRGDSLFVVHNLAGEQFYIKNLQRPDQLFTPFRIIPEGTRANSIWEDKTGNLLFLYEYLNFDNYRMGAILLDTSGQLFDYSPMIEDIPRIQSVSGYDFSKQVYLGTSNGAYFIEAKTEQSIVTFPELINLRHIHRLGADSFLIRTTRGWLDIISNGQLQNIPEDNCTADPRAFQGAIALLDDPQGNIWLKGGWRMTRYTSAPDGSCLTHEFEQEVKFATFLSNGKLAIIEEEENALYIYDPDSRTKSRIAGSDISLAGVPHAMYAKNDVLWVATNKGLYKVNWKNGAVRKYGETTDFEDSRILVIHDNQKGQLWLGTVNQGIHVFDIQQEKVTRVINKSDGLSNDVVVGILEDDHGHIWASTYNGLNLIDASGQIITILKEEDGITHNEFNRYAYFKSEDGRLFFGGLKGLNIIEPELIRQTLQSSESTKIYISQLSYYDDRADKVVHHRNYDAKGKSLTLPAEKRFLSIKVGASNYGRNQRNRYAYRLNGIDQEWTYMGHEHYIRLPNLPSGNYALEIIGIDHNGNKSGNTISIPIYAKDYFYNKAWFYILLAIPLIALVIFWMRRLNKEKETLELEVAKRTEQIQKDKTLIEQQASDLKQLDQMKSRFFANISHDFRTPLTLITGPAEIMEKDSGLQKKPVVKQSIQSILQNSRKLLRLVDEMLDLARLDSNQVVLNEEELILFSTCEAVFQSYQAAAQQKKLQYQFEYQLPRNYHLVTDPGRLEKILNNLIGNALKFTGTGSVIFTVAEHQDKIIFEVKDTGRGIPPEDLPHIFDRYFQSKQEALSTSNGSGIGLSLSLELAKLMGGDIAVNSSFEEGSTFALTLPANGANKPIQIEEKQEAQLAEALPLTKDQLIAPALAESKILIVEDNLEVQEFIKSLLDRQYEVITKPNGLEALEYLSTFSQNNQLPVDLILSDINMPKMNGYELLRALKADDHLRQIPIVMLTARVKEKSKFEALRMGVDDYLTKPFSPTELQLRVNNLLTNYHQRQAYRKVFNVEPQFVESASADQTWLEELEKAILDALDKKIDPSIAYLSTVLPISERQLSRKVKLLTGLTIGKYTQEIKLQKARYLLENRLINSVAEVSYLSGFNSPGYFARVYLKNYGKSPSQYLQESKS